VQDLTASLGSIVSASEASAARRATDEAQAFRRVIEFRGSNLSAEGIFRAKVGDNESDLPFRMSEERDGVRAPQMVVKEEDTGDATFCRTLRLEIVPSKLDSVDKKTYDAIFGAPNSEITFTIFNPDGQKAMKTVKMPPGEGHRP
jgi:hypothetical protein